MIIQFNKNAPRTMTRQQWKYLWRISRMIWKETGPANREASLDALIYGSGFVQLTPQSPLDGKRQRLPIKAERIDPTRIYVNVR